MTCNSGTVSKNIIYDISEAAAGPATCGSGVLRNPNSLLTGQALGNLRSTALVYSSAITNGLIRFPSSTDYMHFKKGQLLAASTKGLTPPQSIIITSLQQFGCCQKANNVVLGGLSKYTPYTPP